MSSQAWLTQVFAAGQASQDGVVRRSIESVLQYSSEEDLVGDARSRGFHVLKTSNQYVILCNEGDIQVLC